MKRIRTGVFETNSSSTHSITVANSGNYTSIAPNRDGTIEIAAADFGWEQETYCDPESKLAYLLIYVRDWIRDELKKELCYGLLEQVVLGHCHATSLEFNDDDGQGGHIDHQSVEGEALNWIFRDSETIKNFVFDRESILETDNDNH